MGDTAQAAERQVGNGQAKQVLWRGTMNPSLTAESGLCRHYITYNGIKQAAARLLHCLGSSEKSPFLGEGGTQAPVAQPADCRICKKSSKKPCLTKLSPNDGNGACKRFILGGHLGKLALLLLQQHVCPPPGESAQDTDTPAPLEARLFPCGSPAFGFPPHNTE